MAQTLTFSSHFSAWPFRRWLSRPALRLTLRVDHGVPGAHLIWDIESISDEPVTLTKLIVRGRNGDAKTVPLGLQHLLGPHERLVLPTDVDWTLLSARSVAAADAEGREYPAPRRQLAAVCDQLREAIDRPAAPLSARDFLSGAADLAFGMLILGLGVFMLMWAIATG